VVARVFKNDTPEDHRAVQPVLSQINFYPLSEFDGKTKITDWSKLPHIPAPPSNGKGESKWVNPDTFFDELPTVMKQVPPLPGEEALYSWIGSVIDAAAKDPEIKRTLAETAAAAQSEIITPLLQWRYNGRPAGNGWNSPVNNAEWGTDYLNRTATAKSNIYDNRRRKRSTSTRTMTARVYSLMVKTPTRYRLPKARCRRSKASGRSHCTTQNISSTPIRSIVIRSAPKTRRSSTTAMVR
jgi:hypothetical protein